MTSLGRRVVQCRSASACRCCRGLVTAGLVVVVVTVGCSTASPPDKVTTGPVLGSAVSSTPDAARVTSAVQAYLSNILSPAVA